MWYFVVLQVIDFNGFNYLDYYEKPHPISLQIQKENQKIQNKINGYRDKKPARSQ